MADTRISIAASAFFLLFSSLRCDKLFLQQVPTLAGKRIQTLVCMSIKLYSDITPTFILTYCTDITGTAGLCSDKNQKNDDSIIDRSRE
ncbi:hypothetical protein BL250_01370 [Erwinia sp. OLTSP20]|nr:hypothetical protein BV501_04910 [Erwinia sp. OAMSP11]PIJ74157.1 hypothetical protein BK416_05195 [Erwinia sp. OLSSP12]PIJ81553.1 hypothetical protein BLD47_08450 [Erwinia sp. OLCASP19]PIJ86120.1 hypothetical protein BLD46_04990 [Erwinia sp. OLMTSP26]PIJ87868.1 hypothetical protein BLD49_04990 [Erwinia sp. OLMDSP33]PIJ90900.1 hypothetical protein BL249_11410 [Erwinia sp. OLFS4]PIJ95284.1 hypothetical protein BL250_01370 [Erwinia sp. OLTSP20]